jgi:toxin HigB-1
MIVGFRDCWLEEYFLLDRHCRFIPPNLESRLFRKLQLLDDSSCDADLRVPPSNHFEKLRGNLEGWHSIRVNDQRRPIFRWNSFRGEAADVYLDNHSYR